MALNKEAQKDLQWALQTITDEWVTSKGTVCVYCCMQDHHNDNKCPALQAERMAKKYNLTISTMVKPPKVRD